MSDAASPQQTADDFIAWAMDSPDGGRWELIDGQAVAMAPEHVAHGRCKLRIAERLGAAVRQAGLPCEVFVDGMAVQVDQTTVYVPDVLMRGGEPLPDDAVKLTDPTIVFEVVSPSSQAYDTGAKLAGYFRIPSLRHNVIVRTRDRTLIHHARIGTGDIVTRIVHDGRLDFGGGLVLEGVFQPGLDAR